jgi:cytochrome c-type biogenesis protein CcmH
MRACLLAPAALGLLLFLGGQAAAALQQENSLDAQVREVAMQLRCPVCQGETVFDSRAGLAMEMKEVVREQLAAGRTPEQILSFFQTRYGDYVLMEPPRRGVNWLIWIGPLVLLLGGILLLTRHLRRQTRAGPQSAAEPPEPTEDPLGQLERLEP